MSLFKIFRGTKTDLDAVQNKHDGYAYYLTDTSNLYIDTATERKKVIGLSQKSTEKSLTNFNSDTKQVVINDAFFIDGLPNEQYSYIVSPKEESFDVYTECGIRASAITSGAMTFSCKEIPKTPVKVTILRIEEDIQNDNKGGA